MKYYISLDVGGTYCRIGLMERDEQVGLKIISQKKVNANQNFEVGIKELAEQIRDVSGEFKIESIGGCFPGIVDLRKGTVRCPSNLPEWENQPIQTRLEELLNIKTYLFHDSAAAAMGEAIYGHGAGYDNFVLMIWGTGVGGAKVENLQGKYHLTSFEPGHHIADPDGQACGCGLHGCPELLIGGGALNKSLGKSLAEVSDNDSMWDSVVKVASQVVINTLAFHQTKLIVFGGGLILKRPLLVDKIAEIVSKKQEVYLMPELRLAKLGDDAALYGAVAMQEGELI